MSIVDIFADIVKYMYFMHERFVIMCIKVLVIWKFLSLMYMYYCNLNNFHHYLCKVQSTKLINVVVSVCVHG